MSSCVIRCITSTYDLNHRLSVDRHCERFVFIQYCVIYKFHHDVFVFLDKYIHCEKICITKDDLVMLSFTICLIPQYLHLTAERNVQFKTMSPAGLFRKLSSFENLFLPPLRCC